MIQSFYNQNLIDRMKAIVPRLQPNYLNAFLRRFAQYDTMRGRNKIEAVTTFKAVDKPLIEAFEKFVL